MSKFYLTVDGVTENAVEIKRSKFIATLAHVEYGEDVDAVWYAETDRAEEMLDLIEARSTGRVKAEIAGCVYKPL